MLLPAAPMNPAAGRLHENRSPPSPMMLAKITDSVPNTFGTDVDDAAIGGSGGGPPRSLDRGGAYGLFESAMRHLPSRSRLLEAAPRFNGGAAAARRAPASARTDRPRGRAAAAWCAA